MATLESAFNPTYSEDASILTGNPNRVTVEVEDTIERLFGKTYLLNCVRKKNSILTHIVLFSTKMVIQNFEAKESLKF